MYRSYFHNKTIVLTGAASGLGLEIAHLLCLEPCNVVLIDIDESGLKDRVAELNKTSSATIRFFVGDVGQQSCWLSLLRTFPDLAEQVDILIANAGVTQLTEIENFSTDICKRIFETNYFGATNAIETFLPQMIRRKRGHIVGVSSLAGARGLHQGAYYSPSKAALTALLESLSIDLLKHKVRVTTVLPGFIDTPMNLPLSEAYRMPGVVKPQKWAKIILHAVARKKRRVMYPSALKVVYSLMHLFPSFVWQRMWANDWLRVRLPSSTEQESS